MDHLFQSHLLPLLDSYRPKEILEVGIFRGANSLNLLNWCKSHQAKLTSVDPVEWKGDIPIPLQKGYEAFIFKRDRKREQLAIDAPFVETIVKNEELNKLWACKKQLSISFLESAEFRGTDFAIIDGDHNYYTVTSELDLLSRARRGPLTIVLHDITNPDCARQDYYYDWKTIPRKYVYGKKQGVLTAIEDFVTRQAHFEFSILTEQYNGIGLLVSK